MNSRDLRNFKVAVMIEDGKDQLQQELRLLKTSQEPIHKSRQIVEELLAEKREPLANGTLEAQRAILPSLVDRLAMKEKSAQQYYQFPCAALCKVPPARFLIKGSTFEPLVVTF